MSGPAIAAKRFVAAFHDELALRARDDIGLLPFLARTVQALRDGVGSQAIDLRNPPPDGFPETEEDVTAGGELAAAILEFGRYELWRPVVGQAPGIDPDLQRGMNAIHAFGVAGPLGDAPVRTGLFVISPGVHYPLHTHVASELYYCVAGRLTLQHGVGGDPFEIAAGDYSITPSGRTHSLTTGTAPVLLVYSWVGEFEAPIHWWTKRESVWGRAAWSRQADGSWLPGPWEPVDAALLARETREGSK